MEEKSITNSAQVWLPGRWFHTNSGVLLHGQALCSQESRGHPGPWRMLAGEGAAALANRGQRLHSFYHQESPWRLRRANQNSKLFNSSAAGRARGAPPTWCGRTEEPESFGREQRGTPRQQASGVPRLSASKAADGFGVLANRDAGGAALPRWEQCGSPPLQALRLSLARGLWVLLSCLGPKNPSDRVTGVRPNLRPASRVPEPSWNWLDRQLRHGDHTGAAGGQG